MSRLPLVLLLVFLFSGFAVNAAQSENKKPELQLAFQCADFTGFMITRNKKNISREKDDYSNQTINFLVNFEAGNGVAVWTGRNNRTENLIETGVVHDKGVMIANYLVAYPDMYRGYSIFIGSKKNSLSVSLVEAQTDFVYGKHQLRGYMSKCTRLKI